MKLRQKLAVVLASAMVVTAVPVVTMAASTNRLQKETLKVKKDTEFLQATTANQLLVEFKDVAPASGVEVFYLDIENAEYNEAAINAASTADVKLTRQSKTSMKVEVTRATAGNSVYIPLLAKATGGDAKVTILSGGSQSTITGGQTFVFATTDEKVFKYSVGDKTTFYTDNDSKLSDLILDESYSGALKAATNGKTILTLEINDTDFNFYGYKITDKKDNVFADGTDITTTVEGKYGFANQSVEVYAAMDKKDNGILYIGIDGSAIANQDSIGKLTIKGLKVDCLVKEPDTGDFKVDIKGDDLTNGADNVVMGEVVAFANYIKMKDDKAKEVTAGRIAEIEFEVGESVENTMISERTFEVKLQDNAHFDYIGLVKDIKGDLTASLDSDSDIDADDYKIAAAQLNPTDLADKVLDNYSKDDKGDWAGMKVEFDKDSDGKAIVDTLIVTVGYPKKDSVYTAPAQKNDQKDKIKFKVKACVPVDKKDAEKVTITAEGRALENNKYETTAITIKNPITITTEAASLKVGLKDQTSTGKVVIAETDKEMFMKDGRLTIAIKDKDSGIKITGATFKVDGEIKRVKTDKNASSVYFDFKRDSNAAATVTVEEIVFDVDRTVPEGTYDIEIKGSAIDQETKDYAVGGHSITVEDFVKIETPNTQDITSGGLAKGTATFVIGESKYVLNGLEKTMDAPSYIQDPGYTMVPVRYVAQAFGVAEKDILFGNGTVTIFAGERTLSLTSGSATALVNGNPVTMGAKVVIKEGRTYAPAGEIARLLGINTTWDATSKTATFTN